MTINPLIRSEFISFFENAETDDEYNAQLIYPSMRRWGDELVPQGLAIVVELLQAIARKTMLDYLHNESTGDRYIVDSGRALIAFFHSAAMVFGARAASLLLQVLETPDKTEDRASLAAYLLASEPFIQAESSHSVNSLKLAFGRAYGTGCKLTLALALHRHNHNEAFKSFAIPHLTTSTGYMQIERYFRVAAPEAPADVIEHAIFEELAFPGSTGELPTRITNQLTGVFPLVALDIATDGKFFTQNADPRGQWRRSPASGSRIY